MAGRPSAEERRATAALSEDEVLWTALQALADPVRLRIVRMLREREQCVCHLTEALGLRQPTISHHVGLLKRAGLVLDRRDARWTYYRLAPEVAAWLSTAIAELLDASRMDPMPAGCHAPESETSCEQALQALACGNVPVESDQAIAESRPLENRTKTCRSNKPFEPNRLN